MATKRKKSLKQQQAFIQLRKQLTKTGQRNLRWYHKVGQYIEKLFPLESGRQYGQNRIVELANSLGKPDLFANDLWNYREFFRCYDRNEVEHLDDPNNTAGFQLSWTHIKCLLAIDNDKKRTVFQNKCIKQKLSTDELRRVILEFQGRKSSGGRSFVRPKTLDAGLRQMIEESNTWIRRHRRVWFDQDDPVISENRKPKKPKQFPDLLVKAIDALKEISCLIEQDLPMLNKMKKRFSPKKRNKGETAKRRNQVDNQRRKRNGSYPN